jgi:hypothetical protein
MRLASLSNTGRKKKQKTFTNKARSIRKSRSQNNQTFFASFFQKRRPSFFTPKPEKDRR